VLFRSPNDGIALGACRTVLEAGPRLREQTELEERLRAMEEWAQPERQAQQEREKRVHQ